MSRRAVLTLAVLVSLCGAVGVAGQYVRQAVYDGMTVVEPRRQSGVRPSRSLDGDDAGLRFTPEQWARAKQFPPDQDPVLLEAPQVSATPR
jgi:hypothetical protein